MNDVLGTRPTTGPPYSIDTSLPLDVSSDLENDAEEENLTGEATDDQELQATQEAETPEVIESPIVDVKPMSMKGCKGTKRKNAKQDKLEKAVDRMCAFVNKSQTESEKLFLSLEEKRLKFDEKMLEME